MLNTYNAKEENSLEPTSILFNFTDPQTTAFENWIEVSDAILIGGRSKATIVPLNGTGVNSKFQFILYGECSEVRDCESHESRFETPEIREKVKIPFKNFSAYFRGTPKSDSNHLNLSHTSRIGIKVYGGSNAPENQFGPGSIEIFTISTYTDDQMPA
ncbi:unnamed protein product [Schistosoma curassoni]|uniref:CIA30 domain-containing protein n=1 Tax=Schistosoma curassoni TaxID=6186 RepID=A0A183K5I5_9TREM|nr:unnamed protein product [Schistosoma curassoni]